MRPPSGPSKDVIPVICEVCNTRMYAAANHVGKLVKCPDCDTPNRIKAPPAAPASKPAKYTGDEYTLAGEDTIAPADSDLVPVSCEVCSTLMYARHEHVGKRIRCPDCDSLSVVRANISKRKPFRPPDVSDVHVEQAPPPQVDEKRRELADRLMSAADIEVARKETEQPVPPERPLRDGLYRFPFYANVVGVWIGMGAAALVNIALLVTIIELAQGGLSAVLCVFLVPIFAVCACGTIGLIAPHLLSIVEFTAEGFDKIPHWPSQDMLSRMNAALLIVNALAMSAAPGMLAVSCLRYLGLTIPSATGLITVIPLMPLVLLSMLWNGSAFVPYAGIVFGSVRKIPAAWRSAWLQLLIAGLAVVVVERLVDFGFDATASICVGVFLVSIYLLFFHRITGRMGWLISQIEVEDDGEDEEEQAEDMGEHEIFAEA